jgi:hypothetical protein
VTSNHARHTYVPLNRGRHGSSPNRRLIKECSTTLSTKVAVIRNHSSALYTNRCMQILFWSRFLEMRRKHAPWETRESVSRRTVSTHEPRTPHPINKDERQSNYPWNLHTAHQSLNLKKEHFIHRHEQPANTAKCQLNYSYIYHPRHGYTTVFNLRRNKWNLKARDDRMLMADFLGIGRSINARIVNHSVGINRIMTAVY